MADWIHNRVAVEGAECDLSQFFSYGANSTPLLTHLPPPAESDLPDTVAVFDGPDIDENFRRSAKHAMIIIALEREIDQWENVQNTVGRRMWSPFYDCFPRHRSPPDGLSQSELRTWSLFPGNPDRESRDKINLFTIEAGGGGFRQFPEEEQNIARYGVPHGYSWRRLAWGSTRPECRLQREGAELRFESAWTSLRRGYTYLSLMFPAIVFRYLWYDDNSDMVSFGYRLLRAGVFRAEEEQTVSKMVLVPGYVAKAERDPDDTETEIDTAVCAVADEWWERLCHLRID